MIFPDGVDSDDRAWLASCFDGGMEAPVMVEGFITTITFIDDEGVRRHKSVWVSGNDVDTMLGGMEITKHEIIAKRFRIQDDD